MFDQYYHLPFVRMLRSLGRKSGMLAVARMFRGAPHASYEESFHVALRKAVRSGDTVWDVGANVGLYTKQFLDWCGPNGRVVAFEPFPQAHTALGEALAEHELKSNATVLKLALADCEGQVELVPSTGEPSEGVSTTMHLRDHPGDPSSPSAETTEVATADALVSQGRCPHPTVTKIDVEGYEEEVLNGGAKVFGSDQSRELFVEVHFQRLEQRGKADAPARIVKRLKDWGYRYSWTDASHLHAFRQ